MEMEVKDGVNPQTEDMEVDRRPPKRKKPCTSSSPDTNSISKTSKQAREDTNCPKVNTNLTCDEMGYSNFTGSINSNFDSHSENRQVSSSNLLLGDIEDSHLSDLSKNVCIDHVSLSNSNMTHADSNPANESHIDCDIIDLGDTDSC